MGCGLCCRFQRNVLDLSVQWRFANLPNNAKLEMVPASRSREGPKNTVGAAPALLGGCGLRGAQVAGCIPPPAACSGSGRATFYFGGWNETWFLVLRLLLGFTVLRACPRPDVLVLTLRVPSSGSLLEWEGPTSSVWVLGPDFHRAPVRLRDGSQPLWVPLPGPRCSASTRRGRAGP